MGPPNDYLDPKLLAELACVAMPILEATDATLLIDDPSHCRIEIVRWPAQGSRPIDENTGDQGGTTEGVFVSEWRGDIHPNIWHEGVFTLRGTQRFFDRQGAEHARVSVDFAREFGRLLEAQIKVADCLWVGYV